MKKRVLSLLLVAAMAVAMMTGCGSKAQKYDGDIKIWVAEAVVDFTKQKAEEWKATDKAFANVNIIVEPVGEGDAAGNVIKDVEAAGDIYGFAQDQLARLVASGALAPVAGDNAKFVKENNDGGAVSAATMGELVYAYPLTSDNGFFLFYDKSVVKDASTLDGVVKACEDAGKNFYFQINSGWYNVAFFFPAGCEITYDTGSDGSVTGGNVKLATAEGVAAMKSMINLAKSKAFVNGSSIGAATNIGAIVTGTWDVASADALWGKDGYDCCKLPTFTLNSKQVQMGGFGGFKLLGVKPQTDSAKLAACHSLAQFLTNADTQKARFEQCSWGPSNLEAQKSDAVKADKALSALAEQLNFTIAQGNYPGDYWTSMEALGDSIIAGDFNNASDTQILDELKKLEETLKNAR